MEKSIFVAESGNKGLNKTSAAKLMATMTALKKEMEVRMQNISFLNEEIELVSADKKHKTAFGMQKNELTSIMDDLKKISYYNGFISYLAEAIKWFEDEKRRVERQNFEDYFSQTSTMVKPESPTPQKRYELQDVLQGLNIKDRAEYLALEAKSACFGKMVQPDRPLNNALNKMLTALSHPVEITGNGRDTIVKTFSPSVSKTDAMEIYNQINREYQDTESHLNHLKKQMRDKQDALNLEEYHAFMKRYEEYQCKCSEYSNYRSKCYAEFSQKIEEELQVLAQAKIAIPLVYEPLLHELYNIGK